LRCSTDAWPASQGYGPQVRPATIKQRVDGFTPILSNGESRVTLCRGEMNLPSAASDKYACVLKHRHSRPKNLCHRSQTAASTSALCLALPECRGFSSSVLHLVECASPKAFPRYGEINKKYEQPTRSSIGLSPMLVRWFRDRTIFECKIRLGSKLNELGRSLQNDRRSTKQVDSPCTHFTQRASQQATSDRPGGGTSPSGELQSPD
jgi:hypothetical protein